MSARKKTSPKKKVAQRTLNNSPKTKKQKKQTSVAPAANARIFRQDGPRIVGNEKGCVIEHREPIGFINQPGPDFTIHLQKALNPGIAETFKWLSLQATGWEKWWFEYCEIEYLARCPSTNTGAVLLAVDHDAADPPPASEDIMMNFNGAVEDSIWVKSAKVKVRCDRVKRFVRSGPLSENLDIKTYDIGNFYGASSGTGASATSAGKVYIRYKVHFEVPQLPNTFQFSSGSFTGGGTLTPGNPLGDAPTESILTQGVSLGSTSRVTFDQIGKYLTTLTASGTAITSMNPPTVFSGAATIGDQFGAVNAGATAGLVKTVVNVTQPNTILSYFLTGGSVTGSHLDIAPGAGLV